MTVLVAGSGRAQCGPPEQVAPAVRESLLVQPAWLARHLNDAQVVVLFVGERAGYDAGHIPGARLVDAHAFSVGEHDLPPVAALDTQLERLGISNDSRVILYGDPWMLGWMYVVLDYVGHGDRTAVLDGGLPAWREAGQAVSTQSVTARPASFTPRVRTDVIATAEWIRSRLRGGEIAVIDTRTANEYRDGHITGATLLEWERTFARGNDALQNRASRLVAARDLAALYTAAGATGNRTPVLYCTIGMRASHMYFVARYLGYEPRMYDGSWVDWSRSQSANPITTGTARGTP